MLGRAKTTSVIYFFGLFCFICAFIIPHLIVTLGGILWWHWLLMFIGELLILIIIYHIVYSILNWLALPANCPECGGETVITSGGFYDGLIPNFDDILIGLLFGLSQIVILHIIK